MSGDQLMFCPLNIVTLYNLVTDYLLVGPRWIISLANLAPDPFLAITQLVVLLKNINIYSLGFWNKAWTVKSTDLAPDPPHGISKLWDPWGDTSEEIDTGLIESQPQRYNTMATA